MKINFKHVATAALAVAMSLSLAVPAFAEVGDPVNNQTLTVTGAQLDGKEVTIVKMFGATITEAAEKEEKDQYEYADYELVTQWESFFTASKDGTPAGIGLSGTGDKLSEAAVEYVQGLVNGQIATFADEAQTWYREEKDSMAGVTTSTVEGGENDTVTFKDVEPGYYLVFPEGGSTGNDDRGTDAILVNVPSNEYGVTVNIKSTYPTVEKKVDDSNKATPNDKDKNNADNGSAQVGDVVTFTLTSAVPDMSDYDEFVFRFTDKLPAGLTLVDYVEEHVENSFGINDVTLKVNNQNVANGKFDVFAVAITEGNYGEYASQGITVGDIGKTLLTVTIRNLKDAHLLGASQAATAGQPIVLTYKAMINENAVVEGNNPVTNEASVQYSNDPDSSSMGTSTPDESTVYTYDINVNKWASDMSTTNLAGAQFQLTRDKAGDDVVKLIATDKTTDGDATDLNNAYRVAKPGEEGVETFTTDDDGKITIAGLEAGTYYLHEVAAPTGYNKLKDPVKIDIIVDKGDTRIPDPLPEGINKESISFESPLYLVNGTANATANDATIKVENKKGIELPETGGIGTIGLTIAGVAIVLIGVFAPRKKKSNQE